MKVSDLSEDQLQYVKLLRKSDHNRLLLGGTRLISDGYAYIYEPHFRKTKKGRAIIKARKNEHRKVRGETLGRILNSKEVVHHKNGVKSDNRPENLEQMTQSEHMKYHIFIRNLKKQKFIAP